MGWERPLYFVPSGERDGYDAEAADRTWTKPVWLPWSAAEQRATREAVAVFDQTSFSKYVVTGPGAAEGLQWVCAADVDVPLDHCVYTPFLNARATYEADLTVTRVGEAEFWLVSSSATTVRDLDWLGRHLFDRVGASVTVEDRTDAFSVIGVMGPRSRELLTALTDADLSEDGFAFATSRALTLAGAPVRATRMTYVGELGWELTVPVEQALAVHDALREAGAGLGARDAGYHAIESLRLEKGFRAFGRELTPDYTPIEAGLLFATALKGEKDFLGRAALEAHRAALATGGPRRRLVSMVVDDTEPMLWGGELLRRDGRPVGQVTSAAWGETVGSCVGLAYVRHDGPVTGEWLAAGRHDVDVAGTAYPVTLSLRAPL